MRPVEFSEKILEEILEELLQDFATKFRLVRISERIFGGISSRILRTPELTFDRISVFASR